MAHDKTKLSFKAIFVGWFVVANLLSALLQLFIHYAATLILSAQGYSEHRASDLLADSVGYLAFALCWEWVFMGLGGYMAARMAGREEMRHAQRVGVLTAGGGAAFALFALVFLPAVSPSSHIPSIAGAIPAALAGGYLCVRRMG